MRYKLFGRSGLRVSELCLGTMTFGEDWGWGAPKDECQKIFDAFVEAGGNFVDTANHYTNGMSEKIVGDLPETDIRRAESQMEIENITLANVRLGKISPNDLTIRRSTLMNQAQRADAEGYPQLARNCRRAAELTSVPNDNLLDVYEKLRPYRATYYELLAMSQELAARYDAPETGDYIRQAAEVYLEKDLLKK